MLKAIADFAKAQMVWAARQKLGQDVEDRGFSIKTEAMAELGRVMEKLPKAEGTRGQLKGQTEKGPGGSRNPGLSGFRVYPGFPIRLGALPGFVVGDRMWKALWKLVENEQRFPRRGGRVLCVHGAVSFHRARPCGRPVCRPGRHEGSLEPYRQNCDESGLQISPPGPLRRHDLPDRGFLHRF